MKQKAIRLLLLVLCTGLLAACSPASGQIQIEIATTPSPEASADIQEQAKQIAAAGIFVGGIDAHSVEITIDGQPRAFSILEVARDISFIKPNEPVELVYIENGEGQPIIKHIYTMD